MQFCIRIFERTVKCVDFVIIIGVILAGVSFGYAFYLWGNHRDEKRMAKLRSERTDWKWYVVKLRLPYMYTEAGRGIIVVEVKAKDEEHARNEAKKVLKGRTLTHCTWVAVNEWTPEKRN